MTQTLEETFGPVIFSYTRKQAIDDGVLIDVSETAREAGIKCPVVVTQRLFDTYIEPSEELQEYGQSSAGRLWDVLWMLSVAAHKTAGSRVDFEVMFLMSKNKRETVKMYALCGPGDDAEPVITIMLPDED